MLFVAFQEVVAGIEKLLQLCFSGRKFVMSAKILVQAILELVLTPQQQHLLGLHLVLHCHVTATKVLSFIITILFHCAYNSVQTMFMVWKPWLRFHGLKQ
jgi:hypothetical protein